MMHLLSLLKSPSPNLRATIKTCLTVAVAVLSATGCSAFCEERPLANPTATGFDYKSMHQHLDFSWNAVAGVGYYRLLISDDGSENFRPVSGADSIDGTVFRLRTLFWDISWPKARFRLQTCGQESGCEDVAEVAFRTDDLTRLTHSPEPARIIREGNLGKTVKLSDDGKTLLALRRCYLIDYRFEFSMPECKEFSKDSVNIFIRTEEGWQEQEHPLGFVEHRDRFTDMHAFPGTMRAYSATLSGDGDTLAVGDPHSSSSGNIGVNNFPHKLTTNNPDPLKQDSDNPVGEISRTQGLVYIFSRQRDRWRWSATVEPSVPVNRSGFGYSLALSADGSTLAVGSTGESGGFVHVYVRRQGLWIKQGSLQGSNTDNQDAFGYSVSLSADGSTLAVGDKNEGSDARSTDPVPDQARNNSFKSGATYVFVRHDGQWRQQAYLKASNANHLDEFGHSVSISADGNTLAVGAIRESSDGISTPSALSRFFDWMLDRRKANPAADPRQGDNSLNNAGAVYIYTRSGESWNQQAWLKASNPGKLDSFGYSVSLSVDGNILAVSAPSESSRSSLIDPEPDMSNNDIAGNGAVYVFKRTANQWRQKTYVKPDSSDEGTRFGTSVSLSANGSTLAVGAPYENMRTSPKDDALLSDNHEPASETAVDAGAVYVY